MNPTFAEPDPQRLGEELHRAMQLAPSTYSRFHADRITPKLILAGHQPELFHPGVWLKNFVLDHSLNLQNSLAINLIIDNDVARTAQFEFPAAISDVAQIVKSSPRRAAR